MSYEKRILQKLLINIVFSILGASAFIIGIYIKNTGEQGDFTTGYLTGTGTALFILGILMCVKNIKLINNKEKLKAYKIENEDERNLALSFKASHYSLVMTVMLLYISSLIFAFKSETLVMITTFTICFLTFFRFILYYIMKKLD